MANSTTHALCACTSTALVEVMVSEGDRGLGYVSGGRVSLGMRASSPRRRRCSGRVGQPQILLDLLPWCHGQYMETNKSSCQI